MCTHTGSEGAWAARTRAVRAEVGNVFHQGAADLLELVVTLTGPDGAGLPALGMFVARRISAEAL